MDHITAKLAIEMQLEDINEIIADQNSGDEYAAFQAMKLACTEMICTLEGQIQALNMLKAEHANRVQFATLLQEERQATRDHNLARRLFGLAPDLDESVIQVQDNEKDDIQEYEMHLPKLNDPEVSLGWTTTSC